MHPDHPTGVFTDIADRLVAASIIIDQLVPSDDAEVSYAATTAALHLHAAQAELPSPTGTAPASAGGDAGPARATDLLTSVIQVLGERLPSLPAGQQTAAARVQVHLAEARDALTGAAA